MSNTALLSFDKKTNRWEAKFGGQVICSSANKEYVKGRTISGENKRFSHLNITQIQEIGVQQECTEQEYTPAQELITFDINERFSFLESYVDMAAKKQIKSVIVCGNGGVGKSTTIFNRLNKNGMVNLDDVYIPEPEDDEVTEVPEIENAYVIIKGYSTARGLYRTLYENRNHLVVFDDCDSVLQNDTASNVLKAALDSNDKRIVSWNSEPIGGSDLPRSFEFTGAVIFISNMSISKIPQAIISRSLPADVSMTRQEIITRMHQIIIDGEFMASTEMSVKMTALNFISQHINNPQISGVNLRTLIAVVTNIQCKPEMWERLSLNMMICAK